MDKKEFTSIFPAVFQYFSEKEISGGEKTAVVAIILAYVLFPWDLIPDVFVPIGWLDDIGVGGLFLAYCGHRMKKVNEMREQNKLQDAATPPDDCNEISVVVAKEGKNSSEFFFSDKK